MYLWLSGRWRLLGTTSFVTTLSVHVATWGVARSNGVGVWHSLSINCSYLLWGCTITILLGAMSILEHVKKILGLGILEVHLHVHGLVAILRLKPLWMIQFFGPRHKDPICSHENTNRCWEKAKVKWKHCREIIWKFVSFCWWWWTSKVNDWIGDLTISYLFCFFYEKLFICWKCFSFTLILVWIGHVPSQITKDIMYHLR